jgi:hypothetical protein
VVALPELDVEADRAAAGGAPAAPVGLLVTRFWDGVADAPAAQQGTVGPAAVALVGET